MYLIYTAKRGIFKSDYRVMSFYGLMMLPRLGLAVQRRRGLRRELGGGRVGVSGQRALLVGQPADVEFNSDLDRWTYD